MAARAATGPAHVAVVSFLAARAAPTGGFWIALAGGVALARVAERLGARLGFGASAAAMLETVAIIGPARLGVPLTQAVSAPILGRLHARGVGFWPQLFACATVRLLHNAATTAFFIWVITGGLDAYAGTYDAVGRRVGIEVGSADALALTLAGLLAWAAFASTVQVLVYRRGLRAWAEPEGDAAPAEAPPPVRERATRKSRRPVRPARRRRCRSRRLRAPLVEHGLGPARRRTGLARAGLGAVAAGAASPSRQVSLFAALLAGGAFVFALGGGLGLDTALRRAGRAALLVLVATWLRSAARAIGLREVSRRVLGRLRRVPSAPEAAEVLDAIASEGRLAAAGRALAARLSETPKRPAALLDAVLAWVIREAAAYEPPPPAAPMRLRARALDYALIASAAVPGLALALA